ncbi:histidine phosphatase family protein [Sphingomonas sp. Xoc002]|uniref:histidine phosphatase family protein n=1 Tax=Sphingomonas sp. Xoc002 TaxID=2837624 RepID=UPI003D184EED
MSETARRPAIHDRWPAPHWPERLWIVRHGESAGNVARAQALSAGAGRIRLDRRDMDIPLSPRGIEQARALGHWFARPGMARPETILASPYVRARETATLFREAAGGGIDLPICFDERLREKEFGILDGLTAAGIAQEEPQQARLRAELGKFYHRPPGGESWCDVILRLRSLMDTVALHHGGRRVMIIAHQVVVLCLRYILEGLSEEEILAIDREAPVVNCGVTEYVFDPNAGPGGGLRLSSFNATAPLTDERATVTAEPRSQDEHS